ncbi:hypothetical protein HA951_000872 [Neisseria gonorrhoeae]|uniref:Lipoprotein n=1 Tax=Neisseria gonorrhoeae TaxID=485 RepID=A0AB74EC18_NEIGO|nr:hypothetical protein [Neisseria gonorrhoeae]KLS32782.1 hypothetical protein M723_05330 [Neisseria gonorrhoeae ATL_2011_01_03]KLS79269.1 hypothetical protein M771_00025 [Neisseria gonorrhoeae MU_NG1]KLS89015.1 hypothetical protein M775_04725 [Neisseria gonorrhoeae MU_NG6]MCK2172300.1 hypothetical protein [Neisseria gonorrhoeae]TJW90147.1 hypothetical protein E8M66_06575 [Neisseria gonorrhoeae]
MKRITLSVLVLMLAACGGKNTDDYVGVWQRDDAKFLQFVEIKKDGGNYLFSQGEQNYTFSEKNGELVLNTVFGEIPFKLSDDRKTLSANLYSSGSNRFFKVEDESCKQLIAELQTAQEKLPLNAWSNEFKQASANIKAISEKYISQCSKK